MRKRDGKEVREADILGVTGWSAKSWKVYRTNGLYSPFLVEREAFTEVETFPDIAGCKGSWRSSLSLRAAPTGISCGDDMGHCSVPADACARGWHVCGSHGRAVDLAARISATDCENASPGRFNAAMSHAPDYEMAPCTPVTHQTTFRCARDGLGSEPVCCGADCRFAKCKDAVWPGRTRISGGTLRAAPTPNETSSGRRDPRVSDRRGAPGSGRAMPLRWGGPSSGRR